jgi:hypothetical protein
MAGAKHARVLPKRLDDSLDDLVLIERVLLIPHVDLVTAHESDPQHYLCHAHAPLDPITPGSGGQPPPTGKSRSVPANSAKTHRHDHRKRGSSLIRRPRAVRQMCARCAGQTLHLLNEPSSVLDWKHNGQMAGTSADHALRASGMLLVGFVLVCCWVTVEGYLPGDEQALAEIHEAVGARLDAPMSTVADITNLEPVAVAAAGVVAILA